MAKKPNHLNLSGAGGGEIIYSSKSKISRVFQMRTCSYVTGVIKLLLILIFD
jgi:hypothetical protein